MFNFPLASLPRSRGDSPGFSINLYYNNKLWNARGELRGDGLPDENEHTTIQAEFVAPSEDGGWAIGMAYSLEVDSRLDLEAQVPCDGSDTMKKNAYTIKVSLKFPDGTKREFRPLGHTDYFRDGYFNVSPNGRLLQWTYATDGQGGHSCALVTSQATTAGMTYYSLDGSYMRLFVPYSGSASDSGETNSWILYLKDGTIIENKPADDPTVWQRITDRNGNRAFLKQTTINGSAATKIEDELGRQIIYQWNQGVSSIFTQGPGGEWLETKIEWQDRWVYKKYRATDVTTTNTPPHLANYELFQGMGVVSKITLPSQSGGLTYEFTYNARQTAPTTGNYTIGWGELKSVKLPTGAIAEYDYYLDTAQVLSVNWDVIKNHVVTKRLKYQSEYDGAATPVTETWSYSFGPSSSTITQPDGSVITNSFVNTDTGGCQSGTSLSTANSNGSITEKLWVNHCQNSYVKAEFNTIPDAAGNPSKTAIKEYLYDYNGNVLQIKEYDWVAYSSIPRSYGVITGLPSGLTLKRVTVNEYYNPTLAAVTPLSTDPDVYTNPSSPKLKNVLKSTEIQDGSGAVKSRTEFYYDDPTNKGNLTETRVWDSTKQALASPDVDGFRLNSNNSVSTAIQYDPYGNPTLTTDANGNQTQLIYGAVNGFTGLYPTEIKSAYNTAVQQTVQTEYDFYTGLPKKVTALGNTPAENVVSETVYDALGRVTIAKAAVGTAQEVWTRTEYSDAERRVIVQSDLFVKDDGKKIAVQHFDQLGRVRLSRAVENPDTEDPTNEQHGIKVQTRYLTDNPHTYQLTSNPYRAATSAAATNEQTMGWTRSKTSNTGRHSEVETFSTSQSANLPEPWGNNLNSTGVVQTDMDAERTLVTNQAGKKRISKTNALGQLTDVWEVVASSDSATVSISFPNQTGIAYGYHTSYQYDTLNNLTQVHQPIGTSGGQTRSFSYSSLSRLLSATNPELGTTPTNGTIQYEYDNNGNLTEKTDARNIGTTYVYDALNRVTNRIYDDSTPDVTYTYDNVTNAKGKLTKVSSSVSETRYTSFDIMGRVTASEQRIPFSDTETVATATPRVSTYAYNLSGALIEQTYPSGRVVKNVLDNDGNLEAVQSKKNANYGFWNYAQNFTYTPTGAVSSMQLGNFRWESTQFNSRLQPTQIALGTVKYTPQTINLATNILKLDYTYNTITSGTPNADNNGNVLSQTITVPTVGTNTGFSAVQTYSYDSLNRIKQATENLTPNGGSSTQTWKQTFTYDRFGNRNFDEANTTADPLKFPKECGTSPNLTMCAADKKVFNPEVLPGDNRFKLDQDNDGTNDYLYDGAGNTTRAVAKIPSGSIELRKFTYDAENKQTKVETLDSNGNVTGTIGEYFYDGDGKRVKKIAGLEVTIFVYDAGGKLVAEYSNQISQTPQVSYLTNDHLGSPRITTDQNGQTISRRDFQPSGEEIATSQRTQGLGYTDDTIRQKFTSYERDNESNLDFAEARYYGYNHGRFTSPDPYNIILESQAETDKEKAQGKFIAYLGKPQQWNRYAYVCNNPLIYIDPSGETLELTGTQKERDKAFERILELCGEKCRGRLYLEVTKDGRTFVKYFDNKGGLSGNAGKIGQVLEDIINADRNVELQVTSKTTITWANGDTENLQDRAALTRHISSQTSQIFISDTVSMGDVAFNAVRNGVETVDGSKFTMTQSIQLAHELGHAWGAIKDNFNERYSQLRWYQSGSSLIKQNNDRSVEVENYQRDRLGLSRRKNH